MPFKWQGFSKKQLQLMTWWMPESPYRNHNGVIAEGAVRSGKTIIMSLSFLVWSMTQFNLTSFAICGKTVGSLRRNVVTPLKERLWARGYKVIDRKAENYLVVSKGKVSNIYYLFGGRDERSQDLIQGITLGGVLLDEVALMPRSFVEQAMARCSVEGSKFWFNCNPEGPNHWFYVEHVKESEKHKYVRIHFNIEDNPSLSDTMIVRYKAMFTGIFYRRFILGEWAFADGVIYDSFSEERNTYTQDTRKAVLPIQILERDYAHGAMPWYGCDYGIYNPSVFLKTYRFKKKGETLPYYYIDDEYYYDGRKRQHQKTDEEYINDFKYFSQGEEKIKGLIVDPSASSLITSARKNGINVLKADNDVISGIRHVHALLAAGHLLINKDRCKNLIAELGLYIWNEKRSEIGKEEPVKANDHACDALRYIIESTSYSWEYD